MAGNDATAPILEVLVSQHHSEHTSLTPEEPRIVRAHPPKYPAVRAVSQSDAEGSAKPGATVVFPIPSSRETGIHFLESTWLEIPTLPGYDPSNDIQNQIAPAIIQAVHKIELLTEDKILIETLSPLDIQTWTQTTTPDEQYRTLVSLAYGTPTLAGMTGITQLTLPLCILKDRSPFPLVSMVNTRLLVRITYSPTERVSPYLDLRGARLWCQGVTIPQGQVTGLETMGWILPITTFADQTRVYEKGSAATLESFLLDDTRDLRSLLFVMGDLGQTTTTLQRYRGAYYRDPSAPDVYRALRECWLDIGSRATSRPLRPEVVRYISRIGRGARISHARPINGSQSLDGEDGIHLLPISTTYRASRDQYSAPGALTRSSAKISLRLRFDPIDRIPGDRDRFEVSVVIQRGQRLSIKDGRLDSVDDFHGDEPIGKGGRPHTNPRVADHGDTVSPATLGSPGTRKDGVPDDVIGYLTRAPTHEPFSRTTRSVALRGSHRFGETIVADLPLTADLVGNLTLRLRLPPLPSGYRWINGIGYHIFERVVVRHEDTVLYDSPGEALFLLTQQDENLTDRARPDANNLGYRAPGTLSSALFPVPPSLGSPDGRLRIPIPWSFGTDGYAPLPTAALRHRRIRLEVTLAKVNQLIVAEDTDQYDPPTISGEGAGYEGCAIGSSSPPILPASIEGGLTITETTADLVGYTIPATLRSQLLDTSRTMILRQIRFLRFDNPEGLLRVLPVNHGLRRLIYASPRNAYHVGGERVYAPIRLNQVYAGSTHWYQRIPPEEFFEDWTRLTAGTGAPDINLYSIDFRPGFLNASRFEELRFQTTPGRLVVVAVSDEPFRVQRGKIGALFSD